MPVNEFGQPIGRPLDGWVPPSAPEPVVLRGAHVVLEPVDPAHHAPPLFEAYLGAPGSLWTYLAVGPFATADDLERVLQAQCEQPDWLPYAIMVDGVPVGWMCYLRIDEANGAIEIGSVVFAPALQRTTAATEAMHLLIGHAFAMGYRRCEWKCDDLNEPSRVAADRLGFTYEGTFRKATHYRGRSRDTAWFSITDNEWPALDAAFRAWLAPSNFVDGNQLHSLAELRAADPRQ